MSAEVAAHRSSNTDGGRLADASAIRGFGAGVTCGKLAEASTGGSCANTGADRCGAISSVLTALWGERRSGAMARVAFRRTGASAAALRALATLCLDAGVDAPAPEWKAVPSANNALRKIKADMLESETEA